MNQLNDAQNEMINKAAAHWGCTRAAAYRKLYPKWQRDSIKAMRDAPDFKAENAQKRAKTKLTLVDK